MSFIFTVPLIFPLENDVILICYLMFGVYI